MLIKVIYFILFYFMILLIHNALQNTNKIDLWLKKYKFNFKFLKDKKVIIFKCY